MATNKRTVRLKFRSKRFSAFAATRSSSSRASASAAAAKPPNPNGRPPRPRRRPQIGLKLRPLISGSATTGRQGWRRVHRLHGDTELVGHDDLRHQPQRMFKRTNA